MTEEQRRREAGEQADDALRRAEEITTRSKRIAKGWMDSRKENNFRLMIRRLGQKAAEHGT